jgi:hypothetical protein
MKTIVLLCLVAALPLTAAEKEKSIVAIYDLEGAIDRKSVV